MTDIAIWSDERSVEITPLKSGGRRDVAVHSAPSPPGAFTQTDIVNALRSFIDQLEQEVSARSADPVEMVNALACTEALLADVRYLRDTIRDHTATALHDNRIRRITVDSVATMEGTSTSDTTWLHGKAMRAVLEAALQEQAQFDDTRWIEAETGAFLDVEALAAAVLDCASIDYWRKGKLTAHGINPDHVSERELDEDGKPVRTPAVKISDNLIRRPTGRV